MLWPFGGKYAVMRDGSRPRRTRVRSKMTPDVRPSASLSGTIKVGFPAETLVECQYETERKSPRDTFSSPAVELADFSTIPFANEGPRRFHLTLWRGPHNFAVIIPYRGCQMIFGYCRPRFLDILTSTGKVCSYRSAFHTEEIAGHKVVADWPHATIIDMKYGF